MHESIRRRRVLRGGKSSRLSSIASVDICGKGKTARIGGTKPMIQSVCRATIIFASVCAQPCLAQTTPDKALDIAEARLDRVADFTSAGSSFDKIFALDGSATQPWKFKLALPFTYNSNVSNAASTERGAFHTTPQIGLSHDWLAGKLKIGLSSVVDLDVHTRHRDTDGSDYSGTLSVRYGDPSKQVSPYGNYTILGIYNGQFGSRIVTTHGFVAGVSRQFDGKDSVFTLDLNAQRREATLASTEQNRFTLSSAYRRYLNDNHESYVFLGGRGQLIHYTGGTARGRDDQNLKISGGYNHKLTPDIAIELAAFAQKNWSDAAGKDYFVFDTGPSITLTSSF
ncbi:hypothetical protein [Sphingomonas sp. GB1N7]|uniref:hypothetical protein n=1 Tax=Parasphingomonas caseinilytica TaxID=3096158 RepID=UPI002FC5B495